MDTQKKTIIGAAVVLLALIIMVGIFVTSQQSNSETSNDAVVAEETIEIASIEDSATSVEPMLPNSDQNVTSDSQPESTNRFANGVYQASTTYTVPDSSVHPVKIEITINNDIIERFDIEIEDGGNRISRRYQTQFKDAINSELNNKDAEELSLSRIGGASLTTNAFNEALDNIKSQSQR